MNDTTLLKEFMEYRCGMYFWLKNLYVSEPSTSTLMDVADVCKEQVITDEIPGYESDFISYFSSLSKEGLEELHKEIKVEYARLFFGPKRIPASPYESVYRTVKKHMFGETTIQVRRLYENAGLEIEKKNNVPDDFIGFELEFMYYLSYETVKAIKDENEEMLEKLLKYQNHFLKEHLTVWIGKFTKNIVDNTTIDYFKVTANCINGFIEDDYNFLSNLLG